MVQSRLQSPWLHHLARTRPVAALPKPAPADIAIVGGGIAGVTSAYFLLKNTKKRVLLIEAGRIAHGATGHNAGQLTSYFERPFHDIVSEFGLELAAQGQLSVDSAWDLLEDMCHDLKLKTPLHAFTGYAGCLDLDELVTQLKNNALKIEAGIPTETVYVADDFAKRKTIPRKFHKLYTVVPRQDILNLLESKDRRYIAALAGKKGCMNSAMFTEELLCKLLEKYAKRFQVAEHTPVNVVRLYGKYAVLETEHHEITVDRVLLCTNGFERITIQNMEGADIDTKFHHLVRGSVGYMAAFLEEPLGAPVAISYLPKGGGSADIYNVEPYFYITRRPDNPEHAAKRQDLICIGGPEAHMDDTNGYKPEHPYPEEARKVIDAFMKKTYRHGGKTLKYAYFWHGLMGFTPNGLRCVGAEPCNPVLMYNLGCNGVGILPSIFGSYRISQIVAGKNVPPSIFDPADRRCITPNRQEVRNKKRAILAFAAFWTIAVSAVLAAYWLAT